MIAERLRGELSRQLEDKSRAPRVEEVTALDLAVARKRLGLSLDREELLAGMLETDLLFLLLPFKPSTEEFADFFAALEIVREAGAGARVLLLRDGAEEPMAASYAMAELKRIASRHMSVDEYFNAD